MMDADGSNGRGMQRIAVLGEWNIRQLSFLGGRYGIMVYTNGMY
jgi:hypothetical protein